MSERNKEDLKTFFLAGAVPTEQQFADLIDSQVNLVETASFNDALTQLNPASGFLNISGAAAFYGLSGPGANSSYHIGNPSFGDSSSFIKNVNGFHVLMNSGLDTASGPGTTPAFSIQTDTGVPGISPAHTLFRIHRYAAQTGSHDTAFEITGDITSSGDISASGAIIADSITGTSTTFTSITASGAISASGTLTAGNLVVSGTSALNSEVTIPKLVKLYFDGPSGMHIYSEGTATDENQIILAKTNNLRILNQAHGKDIIFGTENASGTAKTPLTLNGDGDAAFGGSITSVTNITASGNISASGTVFADSFESAGGDDTISFVDNLTLTGSLDITGSMTASNTIVVGRALVDELSTIKKHANNNGLGGDLQIAGATSVGTDKIGGEVRIRSGQGSGTGGGGKIRFQINPATSSGTHYDAFEDVGYFNNTGDLHVKDDIFVSGGMVFISGSSIAEIDTNSPALRLGSAEVQIHGQNLMGRGNADLNLKSYSNIVLNMNISGSQTSEILFKNYTSSIMGINGNGDLSVVDNLLLTSDSSMITMGAGLDFRIVHDGHSGSQIFSSGDLNISSSGADLNLSSESGSLSLFTDNGSVKINAANGMFGQKLTIKNLTATDETLTAAESGKLCLFSDADGAIVTLPDSGDGSLVGVYYDFYVSVAATSNVHRINVADTTNEDIEGYLHVIDADNAAAQATVANRALNSDGFDAISMDGTTTGTVGTNFRITNIAADRWYVTGHLVATGTPSTPFVAS